MTDTERIEQARQAVLAGKLSWADYDALVLALAVDPKPWNELQPPAGGESE